VELKYVFAIGCIGMLLSFQNCSKVDFSANTQTESSNNTAGDNNGDDGATPGDPNTPPGDDTSAPVVRHFQPALAIRAMGCIQCHAQVASNIITDFGYTNNYFFGATPTPNPWKGAVYGDYDYRFSTLGIPSDKAAIVPRATVPQFVQNDVRGVSSLADYIKSRFAISEVASSKSASVTEKSSIYIGAPTEADITSALKLSGGERLKYYKNSSTSPEFSGLKDEGTFMRNEGPLNCDGDLAVRGPLYLENLHINTKSGCRLYVIGSVFMFGPIAYDNSEANRNLQITSTKSISLGLGNVKKDVYGFPVYCEPTSRFALQNSEYGDSSLLIRYSTHWYVKSAYVRQSSDPQAFGDSIVNEARTIEAKTGPFMDAACRSETRNVSFERILLNAPIIHSRYEGNVSGTIIAEVSIMALGQFKFSFDPVFLDVPVLPYLKASTYLEIKD